MAKTIGEVIERVSAECGCASQARRSRGKRAGHDGAGWVRRFRDDSRRLGAGFAGLAVDLAFNPADSRLSLFTAGDRA